MGRCISPQSVGHAAAGVANRHGAQCGPAERLGELTRILLLPAHAYAAAECPTGSTATPTLHPATANLARTLAAAALAAPASPAAAPAASAPTSLTPAATSAVSWTQLPALSPAAITAVEATGAAPASTAPDTASHSVALASSHVLHLCGLHAHQRAKLRPPCDNRRLGRMHLAAYCGGVH